MSAQGSDGYKIKVKDNYGVYPEVLEEDPVIRGHAWMTYQALRYLKLFPLDGTNKKLAHQARSGNWQRDLSQALIPLFDKSIQFGSGNRASGIDIVYMLLNIFGTAFVIHGVD